MMRDLPATAGMALVQATWGRLVGNAARSYLRARARKKNRLLKEIGFINF